MSAFKLLNLELIRQEVACAVEIEFSAFPFFFPLDNGNYPGIPLEGDGFFLLTHWTIAFLVLNGCVWLEVIVECLRTGRHELLSALCKDFPSPDGCDIPVDADGCPGCGLQVDAALVDSVILHSVAYGEILSCLVVSCGL